jgi:hypothetical protein
MPGRRKREMRVVFETSEMTQEAEFNDTQTAREIYERLPFESKIRLWGQEIYFEVPLKCDFENATMDVNVGDVAYWPQGQCLCIFFGRTPASTDDKPRPASEVNIVGKITGDLDLLKNVKSGQKISVRKSGNNASGK